MRFLIALILLLSPLLSLADIYMEKNANGVPSYSDEPIGSNSVKVDKNQLNQTTSSIGTSAPPPTPNASSKPGTPLNEIYNKKPYTIFAFSNLFDQATIQNQPIIPVDLNINPPLQEGDKIQLYLDGTLFGAGATTHFDIPYTSPGGITRGAHTLRASIVDKNNQVLKETNTITIFVHQASIRNG